MKLINMMFVESIDMEFRFDNLDETDTACGLLRCVDPYWVGTTDIHELDDWKPYRT